MNLLKLVQRIARVCSLEAPQSIEDYIENEEFDVLRIHLEDVVNDIRWRKDFNGFKALFVPTRLTLIEYRDEFENEVPELVPDNNDPNTMVFNPAITSSLHQLPTDFVRVTDSGDNLYNIERRIIGEAINNQTRWQLFNDVGTTYYEGYRLDYANKTIQISDAVRYDKDDNLDENMQLAYITDGWIVDEATGIVYDEITNTLPNDTTSSLFDAELIYYGTVSRFKEDNGYPFQRYQVEYEKKLQLKFEAEQDKNPIPIGDDEVDNALATLDSFPQPQYLRLLKTR